MKNRFKSIGSFIMAAVILLSTLSASGAAYAATGQYFTFTKFSTSKTSPTSVNTSTVDVEGTFNGVSPDSIYYKVDSIVNGTEVPGASGADVKPTISNEKYFTFPNVKLSQGLNRITVFGTTSDGSVASGEAFVNFSNVPAIYNIALPDGTPLNEGSPTFVNNAGLTLTLQAPNASEVMMNSSKMYNGGSTTFVIADYQLNVGYNKLNFVATTDSGTRTYSVTREVIYAPVDSGTPNNTKIGSTAVDTGNVVTSASGKLSGSITFKVPDTSGVTNLTTLTYSIRNTTTGSDLVTGKSATVSAPTSSGSFITFNYTSVEDVPALSVNGAYTIIFTGSYDGKGITPVKFDFRNAATSYITDVQQVYSPSVNNGVVSYTSSGSFSGNTDLFQLPLWLLVKTDKTTNTVVNGLSLTTYKNGSPVATSVFSKNSYLTADGYRVFEITGLPTGEQTLHIDLKSGSTVVDSKTYTVNYVSAPYIELTNLYYNQVFKTNDAFTAVTGNLVNFPSGDIGSAVISINGSNNSLATSMVSNTNSFSFNTVNNKLVTGPNKITISGVANGVPVSTSVTVYLFPDNLPSLAGLIPLPVNETTDPDQLFVKTANLAYTTNQTSADIQFVTSNATQIVIMVDGTQKVVANWDSSKWTYSPTTVNLSVPVDQAGTFTLRGQGLPKTGLRTIVVTARVETSTVSQALQITREMPPYNILSPKLPNESIIKQNFLNVSIQAEGADSIVIGKTPMVKGEKDIFRLEMKNLKKGPNTFKFTINTGTQKTNGSFSVTYSDEVLQGSQLKSVLNSSGKLTAFQNAVTLNFPKGTLLRDATPTPGTTNTRQINLFNNQYILLGIADKQDGRTVKQYNPVGETDSSGNYQDGKLKEVSANSLATTYLTPKLHYGYASNLYWIDPGYFVASNSVNDYETVISSHPYKTGNEFYLGHMGKWLEPTQQGTITLKYDPSLANAATSNISVWKNVDGTWYNMGGKINTSSKTITATFDGFGYYTVMSLRYSYDDIVSHAYARNELETMMAKGIMNAKDSSEFGVYENMTRGEFATMLVKVMGIQLDYEPNNLTFADVVKYSDYHWDYRYIETAVRKGIIKGTAPRVFSPNSTLNREDAAVMIARAMNLKLGTVDKDLAALQKLFTDTGSISSSYSVPSILAVYKAGVISSIPNKLVAGAKKVTYRFDPQAKFTRADAAVMAQRMMIKMKKL
ncbi:S-layer homology domain-containing protein [Paenibacillus apii]|uniref:S-layer homology domain-containing protein n=1 Tax=Paenibacillus apii TaxID=1850370 RepID=UPI001439742A|nr:S-layer homology domain-containing protein [Paenibacillus apii]NJJ39428.1 S-layer homology domain-containing protein [Paenibacillus apii]